MGKYFAKEFCFANIEVKGDIGAGVQASIGGLQDSEQGFEDADSLDSDGADNGLFSACTRQFQLFICLGIRQVTFIELDNDGNCFGVQADLEHVLLHIFPIGIVFGSGLVAAVSDEGDGIASLEDDSPGGVMDGLARDGEEFNFYFNAGFALEVDGEEVEKKRTVIMRGDTEELAAYGGFGAGVDDLQIGGFSRETRAIVDDFYRQFSFLVIELHDAVGRRRRGGDMFEAFGLYHNKATHKPELGRCYMLFNKEVEGWR